jgi:formate hydrogenlyase transcriptional activator
VTRGKSLDVPLSELRKASLETKPVAAEQATSTNEIARIVKETLRTLNGTKDVGDDEFTRKQREEIVRALTQSKGRVGGADGAAARMGINRTTLMARMKRLGIDPRQYA